MHIPHIALMTVVAAICMVGCRHNAADTTRGFWVSDNPESDSLMNTVEANLRGLPSETVLLPLAGSLDSLAKASGDSLAKARYLYIKGRIDKDRGLDSLAFAELAEAASLTDSIKHPYDYTRFREPYFFTIYPDAASRVAKCRESIELYKSVGDSMKVSETYNYLAVIYNAYFDLEKAADFYSEARKWISPDKLKPLFINDYNRALLYRDINVADSAEAIFKSLLSNPYRKRFPKGNCILLVENYKYSGDVKFLHEAYSIAVKDVENGEKADKRIYPATWLMDYHSRKGNADSAAYYAGVARATLKYAQIEDSEVAKALSDYYKRLGNSDSAQYFDEKANDMAERLATLKRSNEVQKLKYQEELAVVDHELAAEKSDNNLWKWLMAVAVVMIGVLLIVMDGVRRKGDKHEKEKIRVEENLEEERRKRALMQMKLTEVQGDWNRFMMLYAEVSPKFIKNLTKHHPNLTTGETRLACLVHLGVDTKDIAKIMSINLDSVKKNRQRLRAKLGIDPTVQLDSYLRTFDED